MCSTKDVLNTNTASVGLGPVTDRLPTMSEITGSEAAKDAARAANSQSQNAIDLQREMWQTSRGDLAPYREAGVNALGQLQNFQMPTFNPADFQASPDYQFRLNQGLDAVNKSAGAGLMRNSGRTLKALNDYGQGMASQEWNNWYGRRMGENQDQWNRLSQVAGLGSGANSMAVNANQNAANGMSQQYGNIGQANAAAAMQGYNGLANLVGQGAMVYGMRSDERLKEGIEDEKLGLDFVKSLRPVRFRYKGEEVTHDGFIAQEVKEALDGSGVEGEMHAYDAEKDIHGIRPQEFIAPLVKAVQELAEKVEALEDK